MHSYRAFSCRRFVHQPKSTQCYSHSFRSSSAIRKRRICNSIPPPSTPTSNARILSAFCAPTVAIQFESSFFDLIIRAHNPHVVWILSYGTYMHIIHTPLKHIRGRAIVKQILIAAANGTFPGNRVGVGGVVVTVAQKKRMHTMLSFRDGDGVGVGVGDALRKVLFPRNWAKFSRACVSHVLACVWFCVCSMVSFVDGVGGSINWYLKCSQSANACTTRGARNELDGSKHTHTVLCKSCSWHEMRTSFTADCRLQVS